MTVVRPLQDGEAVFDATVVEAANPSRIVLFAVGAGGNPHRHLPLLASLAAHNCTVVAPHFERLVSPTPTNSDLLLRARRLRLALNSVWRPGRPVAAVGHSIGATILLSLAGGQIWPGRGRSWLSSPIGVQAQEPRSGVGSKAKGRRAGRARRRGPFLSRRQRDREDHPQRAGDEREPQIGSSHRWLEHLSRHRQ